MKVLMCHNFYRLPGGEDQVYLDECALLESHGHEVIRFTRRNQESERTNPLSLFGKTIWNSEVERELAVIVRRERPDVMHCHNTFPLISPAAYYAAHREGAAVVQTLHNYRLLCPAATFLRKGAVCERCLGKTVPLPAIRHRCYRGSCAATTAVSSMLVVHRALKTWTRRVDRFIALTEFSRQKFIEGGLPAERISVKPNLVQPDPGIGPSDGDNAVFVGRLAPEKGVQTLLQAWKRLEQQIRLKIIGDGPLAEEVRAAARRDPRIEFVGQVQFEDVLDVVGRARALVMPSVWYETFGRTVIEAFATGTPVIASRMGAMQELIDPGRTGLLFDAGNADDLVSQVEWLWEHPAEREQMRRAARAEYEQKYTAGSNYERLLQTYEQALADRGSHRSRTAEVAVQGQ